MPKCKNCGEMKTAVIPVKTDIKTAKTRETLKERNGGNEDQTVVTGALTQDEYWCKDCLDKGEIRQ